MRAGKKISRPSLFANIFLIGAVPPIDDKEVKVTLVSGNGEVGLLDNAKVLGNIAPAPDKAVNDDKSIELISGQSRKVELIALPPETDCKEDRSTEVTLVFSNAFTITPEPLTVTTLDKSTEVRFWQLLQKYDIVPVPVISVRLERSTEVIVWQSLKFSFRIPDLKEVAVEGRAKEK